MPEWLTMIIAMVAGHTLLYLLVVLVQSIHLMVSHVIMLARTMEALANVVDGLFGPEDHPKPANKAGQNKDGKVIELTSKRAP